jgi:hypothetical protein
MRTTFSASLFSKHPTGNPRYRPGDIVITTKKARGTLSRYGEQIPLDIPAGMHGTISEIAPFRPREEYPPRWIYRVRFPGTGETRYWMGGSVLRLVERNPKIVKAKKKARRR